MYVQVCVYGMFVYGVCDCVYVSVCIDGTCEYVCIWCVCVVCM